VALGYSLDQYQVQYSTVQYSTVQYSTVQYSTVQYSTQYSTVYDHGTFSLLCKFATDGTFAFHHGDIKSYVSMAFHNVPWDWTKELCIMHAVQ
jgi:hypothetical protein